MGKNVTTLEGISFEGNRQFVHSIKDTNPIHDEKELDAFLLFQSQALNETDPKKRKALEEQFFKFFKENEGLTKDQITELYTCKSRQRLDQLANEHNLKIAVVAGNLIASLGYAHVMEEGKYISGITTRYRDPLFIGKNCIAKEKEKRPKIELIQVKNGKYSMMHNGVRLVELSLEYSDNEGDHTDDKFPFEGDKKYNKPIKIDGTIDELDILHYNQIVRPDKHSHLVDVKFCESLIAPKLLACQKELLRNDENEESKAALSAWEQGKLAPMYLSQEIAANTTISPAVGHNYSVYVQLKKKPGTRGDGYTYRLLTAIKIEGQPFITGEANVLLVPNKAE